MTRTTPELAPLSKLPRHTNGGRLAITDDLACRRPHTHGGSSLELGFEPAGKQKTGREADDVFVDTDEGEIQTRGEKTGRTYLTYCAIRTV
ncbi:hypothetical protein AVEN_81524-1 [Araneus ventricosus]|uniref:Uncharacterized protein n=1 Tax=Araneus ventricosus TaxID=182803 RepID=A0A4Y2P4T9_ARAVE|nr:hypothetical protein AVEN_81524-1 [Araneus ventricosus]